MSDESELLSNTQQIAADLLLENAALKERIRRMQGISEHDHRLRCETCGDLASNHTVKCWPPEKAWPNR